VAALGLAALQDLLPFSAGPGFFALLAAASLATFALAATVGVRGAPARTAERAMIWTVGGVLVLAPIALGQVLARLDYTTTRDHLAQRVITGLDAYRAREGTYPDELTQLVEAGDLERVPAPRIGFRMLGEQDFVYQNFGESYLLEFSAPRWMQCAYNPPYLAEDLAGDGETPAGEAGTDDLGHGEWSCPSKPPELW
jgi:hypothetical protein